MTKEEILEMSRNENKGMDEREKVIETKIGHVSGAYSLLLGCLIAIINVISEGPAIVEDVLSAVFFCHFAIECGMRARFLKKKSYWFVCILAGSVCVLNTISFITGVLG